MTLAKILIEAVADGASVEEAICEEPGSQTGKDVEEAVTELNMHRDLMDRIKSLISKANEEQRNLISRHLYDYRTALGHASVDLEEAISPIFKAAGGQ